MSVLSTSCNLNELNGLAHIMRRAFGGDDLRELTDSLVARIRANLQDAPALLDLSVVYQLNAQPGLALELQMQALKIRQHYALKPHAPTPYVSASQRKRKQPLKLLAIMGPGEVMANTPIEFLVEESDVALELLYLGEGVPVPREIPDHDVAFVAVCQSDENEQLLCHLEEVMQHWPRPFLNSPSAIAQLARDSVSSKLLQIEGVVTSDAHRLRRDEIAEVAEVAAELFPIIARPVNSHGGHGLAKLDDRETAHSYLKQHVDEEFFVAPFIDYRSRDGLYRKARVSVIDGQPFAAHLAVSQHWMVHYLNADMLGSERNRDEEAHFMASFETSFALRHQAALQEIDERMGLDYYSLDCAETQDGQLVVFEIDSGAVVHSMDPVHLFPYKAPQMHKIFDAFEQLLSRTARGVPRTLALPTQPLVATKTAA